MLMPHELQFCACSLLAELLLTEQKSTLLLSGSHANQWYIALVQLCCSTGFVKGELQIHTCMRD